MNSQGTPDGGAIRLLRGNPNADELAALVAVLVAFARQRASAAALAGAPSPAPRWARTARPGHALADGRPSRPGPDAWRASARPR